jgi:hypothetical protein
VGDVGDDEHGQGGEHVQRVAVDVGVDRVDVVAGQGTDADPGRDPGARTDGVEDGEGGPAHLGDAGDDAVGLAQAHDVPGDDHHDAAVAGHDAFGPVQVVRFDQYVLAVPEHQLTAGEPPDQVADLGPGERGDRGDDGDRHDVQPARAGEDRPRDQRELAGHDRDADVLQQQQQRDRPDAIVIERPGQGVQEAGQRRRLRENMHGSM